MLVTIQDFMSPYLCISSANLMIHVLIADDHPLIRSGVKLLLQQEPDFSPLGEAEDCGHVMRRLGEQHWDMVLLDIGMPAKSGLETLSEIKKLHPSLPVLILSVHSEKQFAIRAIRAGASGYVCKRDPSAELILAIRRVLAGRRYISPGLAEVLAEAIEHGVDHLPHESLSDREFHVVCNIASGKSVSQIAAEASLSVKTISTYRARALEKMNMRTNADLTRYAIHNGLVN